MHPTEYIKVCYAPKECLHDKAYAWSVDGRQLTLQLKKELFAQVIGWPIDFRNQVTGDNLAPIIAGSLNCIYRDDKETLRRVVPEELFEKIEEWSNKPEGTVPYLSQYLMDSFKKLKN
jgi:hypothetical protein